MAGPPSPSSGKSSPPPKVGPRREWLYRVIFEADCKAGKAFDIALLFAILLSIIAVMLESVVSIKAEYGLALKITEWAFTGLFTLEYTCRLISARRPLRYVFSFFGLVDLLSILPTYLSIFFGGTQSLAVIRGLRLVRVFRVFKLGRYVGEGELLFSALKSSRQKITVFLVVILTVVMIIGSLMYLIEGAEHGFNSIPESVYWAIVTMTTVGYGDITPQTPVGKMLASAIMIMGYGIIAVPTGIITAEVIEAQQRRVAKTAAKECSGCETHGHDDDAEFCKKCGAAL
ncbi:MAG: voltage-gated potassium channel [Phycisphaerales bacterium]|jgi:voltage-gated potassium channel